MLKKNLILCERIYFLECDSSGGLYGRGSGYNYNNGNHRHNGWGFKGGDGFGCGTGFYSAILGKKIGGSLLFGNGFGEGNGSGFEDGICCCSL